MCSLDMYNWYENRFPEDFQQLIKIKHYNISELGFLLSKVWYKLDYGEKLLMCAVYYDDFNLARQMLNENVMFRVNPFLSKRYLCNYFSPKNRNFSSSISVNESSTPQPTQLSTNSDTSTSSCWCTRPFTSAVKYRPSASSIQELLISTNEEGSNINNSSLDDTELNLNSTALGGNGNNLSYFFNQRLGENQIYSPFYLAIKLNKVKMCQLFIDYMKQVYHMHQNSHSQKKHHHSLYFYYHHTKCSNSAKFQLKVYLSHFLDESELINLFALTLLNGNFDLAMLILNNCEKPKLILNFYNLSESFIKHKEFCLYLVRARMVEPNVLLKVATNRHQYETTCFLLDHLEEMYSLSDKTICDLYKTVLFNSISIGDYFIFAMIQNRIGKNLNHAVQRAIVSEISIDGILNKKYTNSIIKYKVRANIDLEAIKTLAISKGFDFDAYMGLCQNSESENFEHTVRPSSLTLFNRLKLVNFLFISEEETAKNVSCTKNDIEKIKHDSLNELSQLECYLNKKLGYYRSCFESKSYSLNDYFIIDESEPYIIKEFLKNGNVSYQVTCNDLISISKSSMSELTFYYILANLDFEDPANSVLLKPNDDIYGNFVEILFCRLVKGLNSNKEQEIRLRKLFFEMIVLKNAKITCTVNMLSLFMSRNQFTKQRLIEFYFPTLFYLANSFNLFPNELYKKRFDLLVNWLFNNSFKSDFFSGSNFLVTTMSQENIEFVIFQYYSGAMNKSADGQVKFKLDLKELARNSFMKAYLTRENKYHDRILNLVSESTRKFIFHFDDMKNLF